MTEIRNVPYIPCDKKQKKNHRSNENRSIYLLIIEDQKKKVEKEVHRPWKNEKRSKTDSVIPGPEPLFLYIVS